jgi:hypothetical protein
MSPVVCGLAGHPAKPQASKKFAPSSLSLQGVDRVMRTLHRVIAAALLLALVAPTFADAEKTVKEQLEKLNAGAGRAQPIRDEGVARSFPNHDFVAVIFPQFPVARLAPAPLKASNIYAVTKDGKLTLINDQEGLEKFFRAARVGEGEGALKDLVRAWLVMSAELHQDGFYKFKVEDDSLKVADGKGSGKIVVTQGGNGELRVSLTVKDGVVKEIKQEAEIKRGVRPKCQATLLLDPNPLVREIAEQDLLVMGRPALPYLAEQHARASRPLQQAIERVRQRILADDR